MGADLDPGIAAAFANSVYAVLDWQTTDEVIRAKGGAEGKALAHYLRHLVEDDDTRIADRYECSARTAAYRLR